MTRTGVLAWVFGAPFVLAVGQGCSSDGDKFPPLKEHQGGGARPGTVGTGGRRVTPPADAGSDDAGDASPGDSGAEDGSSDASNAGGTTGTGGTTSSGGTTGSGGSAPASGGSSALLPLVARNAVIAAPTSSTWSQLKRTIAFDGHLGFLRVTDGTKVYEIGPDHGVAVLLSESDIKLTNGDVTPDIRHIDATGTVMVDANSDRLLSSTANNTILISNLGSNIDHGTLRRSVKLAAGTDQQTVIAVTPEKGMFDTTPSYGPLFDAAAVGNGSPCDAEALVYDGAADKASRVYYTAGCEGSPLMKANVNGGTVAQLLSAASLRSGTFVMGGMAPDLGGSGFYVNTGDKIFHVEDSGAHEEVLTTPSMADMLAAVPQLAGAPIAFSFPNTFFITDGLYVFQLTKN